LKEHSNQQKRMQYVVGQWFSLIERNAGSRPARYGQDGCDTFKLNHYPSPL
jgi:hypothetical protein